jgi:hypothetical protein
LTVLHEKTFLADEGEFVVRALPACAADGIFPTKNSGETVAMRNVATPARIGSLPL